MAIIALSTNRAVPSTRTNPTQATTGGAQIVSFAQAKAVRSMPTYLKGGRI